MLCSLCRHALIYCIALKFCGSSFHEFPNLQNYFNEHFDTSDFTAKIFLSWYFKSVDGQYPGSKLPDPQGMLSKKSALVSDFGGKQ